MSRERGKKKRIFGGMESQLVSTLPVPAEYFIISGLSPALIDLESELAPERTAVKKNSSEVLRLYSVARTSRLVLRTSEPALRTVRLALRTSRPPAVICLEFNFCNSSAVGSISHSELNVRV